MATPDILEVEWSYDGKQYYGASCPFCQRDCYMEEKDGVPANEVVVGCRHFIEYDKDVAVFDRHM